MATEVFESETPGTTDRRLFAAASQRLACGTGVPPGVIDLVVVGGHIWLTGDVDYAFQRKCAARRLDGLDDVKAVHNDVRLRARTGRTVWDDYYARPVGESARRRP